MMVRRLAHTEEELVTMTVRVPSAITEALDQDSIESGTSRNANVVLILDDALRKYGPGATPDYASDIPLYLRLPKDLHERVKRVAGAERMSMNSIILRELKHYFRIKSLERK